MIKLPVISSDAKKELAKKYSLTIPGVEYKLNRQNDLAFIRDALAIEKACRLAEDNQVIQLQQQAEELIKEDHAKVDGYYDSLGY